MALLDQDQTLQHPVLSVFHTTTQTFDRTGAAKIVENHNGKAFVKQYGRVIIQQGQPQVPGVAPVPRPPLPGIPTPISQPQTPTNTQNPQPPNSPSSS